MILPKDSTGNQEALLQNDRAKAHQSFFFPNNFSFDIPIFEGISPSIKNTGNPYQANR